MFENIQFKPRFLLYVYVLDNACTGSKRVRVLTRFFVATYDLAIEAARRYIERHNFMRPIVGWEVRPACVESPKAAIRRQQNGTAWRTMNYAKRRPKAASTELSRPEEEEESTGECIYTENDLDLGIR